MELIKYKYDDVIAIKNEKVKYCFLVDEGSVIQKLGVSELKLEKNSIVGIHEKDIYLCDYYAAEDTVLAAFVCENSEDLKNMLLGQEKIRSVFLKSAVEQRHNLLCLYSNLYTKAKQFHSFVENTYNDYQNLCAKHRIEERSFSKINHFNPLKMLHKAENWEINNSVSLVKNYMQEYLSLMQKDDGLTIGVIMEAAAQMRRFAQGISEMESYLSYNKDILISESDSDIFKLYFELSKDMYNKKFDITQIAEKLNLICNFAEKLNVYNSRMIARKLKEVKEYNYKGDSVSAKNSQDKISGLTSDVDFSSVNCLEHILEYAGYKDEEIDKISGDIISYRNLPDMLARDSETYALRKSITNSFYDVYYRVFIRAMINERSLTPILKMFLNFGFMDLAYVGEEQAKELCDLCAHLDICKSDHVYTIYEWLKCIYRGEKEPSKNEFDMNYAAYLADLYKRGKITKEDMQDDLENRNKRVEFEIRNMFASVNKVTYGRITSFCPILSGNDLINSVEKMIVSADKLENALNEVRKLDYSVFYREIPFSDPECGITNEKVMKEIIPDIILMPNAGTNTMMWQEISGVRSNTPGRFMFPIFTASDLEELMLEVIGRFRWEMCRRLQGMHWNDVREKSLTAEYCSYIQFYRKNHDLSPEAKEKLASALVRAKNNYREVFVRDYINWIKFESKGSFRLNKVARDILIRYCPFVKSVRNELKANPMYQNSINRFETENQRLSLRYNGVYNKYIKAGGYDTADLKETVLYYEM